MIEIGLTVALYCAGLAMALGSLRWLARHDVGTPDARRVVSAVRRALRAFVWAEFRVVALATAGLAGCVFCAVALLGAGNAQLGKAPMGKTECAFWLTLLLLGGALLTCLLVFWSVSVALASGARVAAGARVSLDRISALALRAGGITGLLVEVAAFALVAGAYALLLSFKGALALPVAERAAYAVQLANLLPGCALGVALAALVVQRGGAIFYAASHSGGAIATELDVGVNREDPRNPAVVSALVGGHVGAVAGRCVDFFMCSIGAHVVCLMLAAQLYASRPDTSMLRAAAVPLVVRAFGVLASIFGIFVVRLTESSRVEIGLWRGHASVVVITLAGLISTCLWLLGRDLGLVFIEIGVLGLVTLLGLTHLAWRANRRHVPQARRLVESVRSGDATNIAYGLGAALRASLPFVAFGAVISLAWRLGAGTGLPHGGLLALVTLVATLLASTPFLAALSSFGPIASAARAVTAVSRSETVDSSRRLPLLDDAGQATDSVVQNTMTLAGCLLAFTTAATLVMIAKGSVNGSVPLNTALGFSLLDPASAWSALLGAAVVLSYAGHAAQSAALGAHDVAGEVERQLRGFPREGGRARIPHDHTPSYRACIDLSTRHALGRLMVPVALAFTVPVALGVGLSLLYRDAARDMVIQGSAAYGMGGALAGLAAALGAESLRAALSAIRRTQSPTESSSGFAAAVNGNAVGDIVGATAGPAANLLAKSGAIAVLAIAPFLA